MYSQSCICGDLCCVQLMEGLVSYELWYLFSSWAMADCKYREVKEGLTRQF